MLCCSGASTKAIAADSGLAEGWATKTFMGCLPIFSAAPSTALPEYCHKCAAAGGQRRTVASNARATRATFPVLSPATEMRPEFSK